MADFAPEAQMMQMVEREFVKMMEKEGKTITWDQGNKILSKVLTSSSRKERNNILYDADQDWDNKILLDDFKTHIQKYLNEKKNVDRCILNDEKSEQERLADCCAELLDLGKNGVTIDPQMLQQIAEKHKIYKE